MLRRHILRKKEPAPPQENTTPAGDEGGGADDMERHSDELFEDGEEEGSQLGDAVCAECESGGMLDTCDGCARSWHAECLAMSLLPGRSRYSRGVQPCVA